MGSGAHSQDFFGQFKGLFKEFGAKRGGHAPPPPLDPRLPITHLKLHNCLLILFKILINRAFLIFNF